ncbi:MAG: biotin transporter BioY [Chlamydiota bacterium]
METLVESAPTSFEKTASVVRTVTQVVSGSLFLAALSQVSIPLHPVPISLQTLGIFLLAVTQGGGKAFSSSLLYLGLATLGLPFLAGGGSDTMWAILPSAGYLFGFPITSYVIGKMVDATKNPSPLRIAGSILVGQIIIYVSGVFGLTRFLSFEQSLMSGLVPFLPLDGVKLLTASAFGSFWVRFKKG